MKTENIITKILELLQCGSKTSLNHYQLSKLTGISTGSLHDLDNSKSKSKLLWFGFELAYLALKELPEKKRVKIFLSLTNLFN